MAAKVFEVGDILPATMQLRISWNYYLYDNASKEIKTDTDNFALVNGMIFSDLYINDIEIYTDDGVLIFNSPYTDYNGEHPYIDIDTSTWTLAKRTVSTAIFGKGEGFADFYWEDLNVPSVYSITFEENDGTSVSDLTEQTALPDPLPIPTKKPFAFGGWYYESGLVNQAKAGDTLSANVTLYAKWFTMAQVLVHINNVVEELRSAIIDKGGDAEGKLLIDFATIINLLKTYEVVETLAELELLEPKLNRLVYVEEGSGELAMGEPVKVTQDGDTLIIG